MLIIEYSKYGDTISDFEYENWLNNVKHTLSTHKDEDIVFKVSTTLPIYAIRLAVVKDEIDYTKVKFKFEDVSGYKESSINEYGVLNYWPIDNVNLLIGNILTIAMKKRKEWRDMCREKTNRR